MIKTSKDIVLPDGTIGKVNTYKKSGDKIIIEMPETIIETTDLTRFIETQENTITALKNQLAIIEADVAEMKKML